LVRAGVTWIVPGSVAYRFEAAWITPGSAGFRFEAELDLIYSLSFAYTSFRLRKALPTASATCGAHS
jgi:hypothetical protein